MKKNVFRGLLALIMLLTSVGVFAQSPVKKYGQLKVVGSQLCSQDGNPVVLRGVSLGWHNLWPRFYNKGAVDELVNKWHATLIRAAMGVKIEDNYLENPSFAMECITPVIEEAIKDGVYVIIDWHAHEMFPGKAAEFFDNMSKKYGKYPNVIYELYNEPIEDSWLSLKDYAETIIKVIRKNDPDNIILMGCGHWDQDIDKAAADPIKNVSNVMYTVHFYAATHKQYLRDRMEAAIKSGLPVFVSECGGTEASGDGFLDKVEFNNWVDCMERLKVSYACWSLSDKNETCSMLLPRAKANGSWTDDVIKPWGKLVKETLTKYNR